MHHLVGVAEVAEILGVSPQRVHQLRKREDFPAPLVKLAAGYVWERVAIEQWLVETGRRPDNGA